MTKPRKLALGIGFAALLCGVGSWLGPATLSWPLGWTCLSCLVATGAYVANRPELYGKREGRLVWWRALPSAIYLLAFRIACAVMRAWRRHPPVSQVTPRLWVAGRIGDRDLPDDVDVVVDLVSEFPEPRSVRRRPGYRFLAVLDGGVPRSIDPVLELLDDVADPDRGVLVHCDSGIGRAPTFAALVLLRRGEAADVDEAIERIERARPFIHLGSAERAFLSRIAPRIARPGAAPTSVAAAV